MDKKRERFISVLASMMEKYGEEVLKEIEDKKVEDETN
jgi:hypothetical protein